MVSDFRIGVYFPVIVRIRVTPRATWGIVQVRLQIVVHDQRVVWRNVIPNLRQCLLLRDGLIIVPQQVRITPEPEIGAQVSQA